MGVEEVLNPVYLIKEGFLEEVVSWDGRRCRSQLGRGRTGGSTWCDRISDPKTCN